MAASCGSPLTASARISIVPGDHGQDVVEVVRDAAGELADRLHLFGLPDPLLGRDLVGEVADEPVEHEAAARPQRGDAQLRRDFLAVPTPDLELAAGLTDLRSSPERRKACRAFLRGPPVRLADQFEHILPERFIARPAEDLLGLRIPVPDEALLVDLDEGVERSVDDAARQSLAFAQRLLRQPALGHVAADEEEALGRFGPCSEPGQPHRASVLVDAACVGKLRALPAPRRAHFLAGFLEMVGMDEVLAAAADHFLRPVAEDGLAARADLHQKSPASITMIRSCEVSKMRRSSSVCRCSACLVLSVSVMSAPLRDADGRA